MSAWRGAVEFGGFPINVKFESRVRVTRAPSFKTLAKHDGLPPVSKKYAASDPAQEITETVKGVQLGKSEYAVIPSEAVEKIKNEVGKDVVIKPHQFVPKETIDLTLTYRSYKVRPDDKVPGAETSAQVLFNGLRVSGLAYVCRFSRRGGSMDAILAIFEHDGDLVAVEYPFVSELFGVTDSPYKVDDEQGAKFEAFLEAQYADQVGEEFDHGEYVSTFQQTREEAISAALAGETIEVPEVPEAEAEGPNLMAILEDGIKETGKAKAKAKPKRAAKKPAAKPRKKATVKA